MKNTVMQSIMKRAWFISKNASRLFGGKAVQYLSMSLKLAWSEVKLLSSALKLRNNRLIKKFLTKISAVKRTLPIVQSVIASGLCFKEKLTLTLNELSANNINLFDH